MREEIQQLVKRGQLPSSDSGICAIQDWQGALEKIGPPLSDKEAIVLTGLFPKRDDECFGLAWTLVHLVETAPNWPLQECLQDIENPWIVHLRQAARLDALQNEKRT